MEIDITYYDVNIGRNRRFSLSYDQLREVAEMDETNVSMPQVANYAMRLNALFAQMQGLDNDAGTQLSLEMLQRIMSAMTLITKPSEFNRVPDEYIGVDPAVYAPGSGHDFEVLDAAFATLLTSEGFVNKKSNLPRSRQR